MKTKIFLMTVIVAVISTTCRGNLYNKGLDSAAYYLLFNNAPIANDISITISEDTAVEIELSASDPDLDMLSYHLVDEPGHGVLDANETSPNRLYTPELNYNGTDSFTFYAQDETEMSNTATVRIMVEPVNDKPIADEISVSSAMGSAVNILLKASDADDDMLTWLKDSDPENATLEWTPPEVKYTPDSGFQGSDSFSFHVNDGNADSNIATVSITVVETTAPEAYDQSVNTQEDTPVIITLTAYDADGDTLTWLKDSDPGNGILEWTTPEVKYTPDSGFQGSDSFTFHVNDGNADSNIATVSINVLNAGTWVESDMGFTTGAEQKHIAIGDGQNNGLVMVYTATDDDVYEYAYEGNEWVSNRILDTNDAMISSFFMMAFKVDLKNRLYAIDSGTLHELSYVTDYWSASEINIDIFYSDTMSLGDGRDDDYPRIYLSGSLGSDIKEFSYNNEDWDMTTVDSVAASSLLVADGRNDGKSRLYVAVVEYYLYEYTYNGSGWEIAGCAQLDFYNQPTYLIAADGRNDTKNRIYLVSDWDGVVELSYNSVSEEWETNTIVDKINIDAYTSIAIGSAREDGLNRIYVNTASGIGEYFYNETWSKISNIEISYSVKDIAIGNGRNDGVNRLYVTGDDNHIYEYSCE